MTLYKAKKIMNEHAKDGLVMRISQYKTSGPLIIIYMGYKGKMLSRPWTKSQLAKTPEDYFVHVLEQDIEELTITPEEKEKKELINLHYTELRYKFDTLLINLNIRYIEFNEWLKDASLNQIKMLLSKDISEGSFIKDWMEIINGK